MKHMSDPHYTRANAASVHALFSSWQKANTERPAGTPEFTCWGDVIRCALNAPDGSEWAAYRVLFIDPVPHLAAA
jgi:hypothetical protein